DVGSRVVVQLADMVEGIKYLGASAQQAAQNNSEAGRDSTEVWLKQLAVLSEKMTETLATSQPKIEVINQPVPGIDKILHVLAETIENSNFPLVRSMDKKLDIDLRTHEKMQDVLAQLRQLEAGIAAKKQAITKANK